MEDQSILCTAGQWTPVYQRPSLGAVALTNLMITPMHVHWRVVTASLPFYWQGEADLTPGEPVVIVFGLPTLFAQFEVSPPLDAWLLAD